jgi:hypothetical protein
MWDVLELDRLVRMDLRYRRFRYTGVRIKESRGQIGFINRVNGILKVHDTNSSVVMSAPVADMSAHRADDGRIRLRAVNVGTLTTDD